jgi:uncharacterized membrane protein (DUF2068 family)
VISFSDRITVPIVRHSLNSYNQKDNTMEITNSNQIVRSVWMVLKITFTVVPIVAGLDKFTDLLVNWDMYLNPQIASMLPFSEHTFMQIVGVIEIVAGVLVFVKPAVGGWIVMAWLVCISLTLIASGKYLDVAVRDLVMSIGAMSLARLSRAV